ncbi:MAG: GNAT family N-acetyltransferase, partial [Hyphomicrobiaceae bacterium]
MSDHVPRFSEPITATIGPAGLDHWADIRALHALAFRHLAGLTLDDGQIEAFAAHVREPEYTESLLTQDLLVAWHDARPVGTAGWTPDDRGALARITSVCVSPLFTRLGVGRSLVAAAEERARAAGFRSFSV